MLLLRCVKVGSQRRLETTDLNGNVAILRSLSWEPKALGNHPSEGSCCYHADLKLGAKGAWEPSILRVMLLSRCAEVGRALGSQKRLGTTDLKGHVAVALC